MRSNESFQAPNPGFPFWVSRTLAVYTQRLAPVPELIRMPFPRAGQCLRIASSDHRRETRTGIRVCSTGSFPDYSRTPHPYKARIESQAELRALQQPKLNRFFLQQRLDDVEKRQLLRREGRGVGEHVLGKPEVSRLAVVLVDLDADGVAPDLSRRSMKDFTPASLAASFWNHGPRMWKAMEAKNLPITPLSANEIADLYAYFHSIRYFDPRGEAGRGKALFTAKKCTNCHDLTPGVDSGKPGPPLSEWPALSNQIQWMENLWNHSGGILAALEKSGNKWPILTPQEMTDLLVYIRSLPQHRKEKPALVLEDPEIGEQVFTARSCGVCHTVGAKEAGKLDLLASAKSSYTFTELSVRMWNHLPRMRKQAAWAGIPFPAFSENEMSQLLAYLFAKRYFEEQGKPVRGKSVFTAKKCVTCHDQPSSGALDLR
ncbi:MAG: c-type cytochrome, partial [Acidobacteria bacterium]|nr:c-type cytochrome [Acidobacteriota bacterium]